LDDLFDLNDPLLYNLNNLGDRHFNYFYPFNLDNLLPNDLNLFDLDLLDNHFFDFLDYLRNLDNSLHYPFDGNYPLDDSVHRLMDSFDMIVYL
jgi:hypothetical protein